LPGNGESLLGIKRLGTPLFPETCSLYTASLETG